MNTKEERLLRAYIRKGLEHTFKKRRKQLKEETKLRKLIQTLILQEAAEKVEADPHQYTGINVLRELFRNSNVLKTLREKYKTMTTNKEQRDSFRAHIITWVLDTLAPVYALDQATLNEIEDVDIDVITDEEREMFIDADDGSDIKSDLAPEEEEEGEGEEDEEDDQEEIPDKDTTGRNAAKQVYPTIETSIVDFFSSLNDQKDQEIFKRWSVANLKLYFDKWEKELEPFVEEPGSEEYDKAQAGAALSPETPGEEAGAPGAGLEGPEAPLGPEAESPEGESPEDLEKALGALPGIK